MHPSTDLIAADSVIDGTRLDPMRILVAGFLARYRGKTREAYTLDLRNFLTWCRSHELDPLEVRRPHIELWLRWQEEHADPVWAAGTISRRLTCVRMFYRVLVYDEVIVRNPCEMVKGPPRTPAGRTGAIGRTQLALLLQAAEKCSTAHAVLISLMGICGLRVSEACSLDVEHVMIRQRGHVTMRVLGKGRMERETAPLPPPVAYAIERHLEETGQTSGPLLVRASGTRLTRRTARDWLQQAAAVAVHANIERIHPHMLRATAITVALEAGEQLDDVQRMARHADPRTTQGYDRRRSNLDRHSSYRLAGYIASTT